MSVLFQETIAQLLGWIRQIAQALIVLAALALSGTTFAMALGLLPRALLSLHFGDWTVPNAGMWAQTGLTLLVVSQIFHLPTNLRMARLERSHRSFAVGMEDVARAYRVAHAAGRTGVFALSGEFESMRARFEYLRQHPGLDHLEPELLNLAAQMSFLSRDLAQTCSDAKVSRARSFLKQRQEDAHRVADRVGLARRTCHELRRWLTDIEAEECQSQQHIRRLEAERLDILPTFGYDFDLDVQVPGNVVPLNKPGKNRFQFGRLCRNDFAPVTSGPEFAAIPSGMVAGSETMILFFFLMGGVALTGLAIVVGAASAGVKLGPFGGPSLQRIKARREMARILGLDSETLAELQMEITMVGDVAPTSYHLFPTGHRAQSDAAIIRLPRVMRQERLSGKALRLKTELAPGAAPKVTAEFCKAPSGFSQLGGKEFDLVGIPRVTDATGKAILRPAPEVWLKRNPRLMDLALEICPQHPTRVFEVLLTQGSINAAFKWAETPETYTCEACKTRRQPVMQLWGQALGLGAAAQVYVLACNCAADQFSTVVQFVGQTFG